MRWGRQTSRQSSFMLEPLVVHDHWGNCENATARCTPSCFICTIVASQPRNFASKKTCTRLRKCLFRQRIRVAEGHVCLVRCGCGMNLVENGRHSRTLGLSPFSNGRATDLLILFSNFGRASVGDESSEAVLNHPSTKGDYVVVSEEPSQEGVGFLWLRRASHIQHNDCSLGPAARCDEASGLYASSPRSGSSQCHCQAGHN